MPIQTKSLIGLLSLSQLRHLYRHRLQTLLTILGIALGVAVVNAVDISNYSAKQNLRSAVEQSDNLANYRILSAEPYFDQNLYAELRRKTLSTSPEIKITPVLIGVLRNKDYKKTNWQLLGIDILTQGIPANITQGLEEFNLTDFITQPNSVIISKTLSLEKNIQAGSTLNLELASGPITLTVAGIIEHQNPRFLLADMGNAQSLLAASGKLSYLDIVIPATMTENTLTDQLPDQLRLVKKQQLIEGQLSLIQALDFNLSALSLLALVVGAFLIFSTIRFSVLQRTTVFARLRIQGVTAGEIKALLLKEAILLAAMGIILGWILGFLLSQLLAPISNRIISDLYSSQAAGSVVSHWSVYLKTAILGLITTLSSAYFSIHNLQQLPLSHTIARVQQEITGKNQHRWQLLASIFCVVISMLFAISDTLISAYLTTFLAIAAAVFLLPTVISLSYPLLLKAAKKLFGTIGLIALRDCQRESSRVLLAIIALCVAVSATNGIAIMVDSFRLSVNQWIETQLNAEIYIRAQQTKVTETAIDPELIEQLLIHPSIEYVFSSRLSRTFIDNKWLPLNVIEAQEIAVKNSFAVPDNEQAETLQKFINGQILISEPLARKQQLAIGDQLTLLTAEGSKQFPIAAIFKDYGAEHGRIVIEQKQYQRLWNNNSVDSLAVYTKKSTDIDKLITELEQTIAVNFPIQIIDSKTIRKIVLIIFERTFAITQILQLLVLVIAVIAIISTLMIYQLQRREQLLTLRALGLSTGELRQLFFLQAGFIGGMAGLLAIPLGLLMAWLLTDIINPAAFGWSLTFHASPSILINGLIIALLAGLLSAIYPSIRFSRNINIAELSRE